MNQEAPDKSLNRIYVNLEKLKASEDELASKIQESLRIIVSWIITSLSMLSYIFMYIISLIFRHSFCQLGRRWGWNSWLASWSCF